MAGKDEKMRKSIIAGRPFIVHMCTDEQS